MLMLPEYILFVVKILLNSATRMENCQIKMYVRSLYLYATILTVSDYYADIIAHIGADIVKNIRQLICCPFCGISAWLSFR